MQDSSCHTRLNFSVGIMKDVKNTRAKKKNRPPNNNHCHAAEDIVLVPKSQLNVFWMENIQLKFPDLAVSNSPSLVTSTGADVFFNHCALNCIGLFSASF